MDVKFTTISIFGLMLVAASATDANNDLYERIEKLEQQYARGLTLLEERIEQRYARHIANLEERVTKLEYANRKLVTENDHNKAEIATLARQAAECKQLKSEGNEEHASHIVGGTGDSNPTNASTLEMTYALPELESTDNTVNERESINRKRALVEGGVAFTAYLDHDLENQGPDQVFVFNKVLLNHGNAYNSFSGMFTAPMAGVYSFTFVIGQRSINEYYATLVVNNQHMVDAVCETMHDRQDLQGGNTANVMLSQGDIVFVKHLSNVGTHVEGADNLRISSFSGFLLYPVDAPGTVVGK